MFGSTPNRLSKNKRALSKYSVGAQEPGLAFDFVDNVYQKDQNKTANFSGAITHARAGNATMTDGYGPELVTNGGFDSGTDGWSVAGTSCTLSYDNGKAQTVCTGTDGNSRIGRSVGTLTAGTAYIFTLQYYEASSYGFIRVTSGSITGSSVQQEVNTTNNGNRRVTMVFVPSTTQEYFVVAGGNFTAGSVSTFDNVSVREMPVLKWAPHNLHKHSEDLSNADWSKGGSTTVTANHADAPDGTNTADRLQMPASGGTYIAQSATFVSGVEYTVASFVKATSADSDFQFYQNTSGSTASSSVFTATDTWQLFTHTFTASASGSYVAGFNNGVDSYASDILVWGMHLYRSDLGGMVDNPDQPPSRASYVPTTSTAEYLPRIGHHVYNGSAWVNEGLLAESESRTNLAPQSDMSTAEEQGCTRTANNAVSPDGTENAFTITASSTAAAYLRYSGLLTNGESYAVSVYAKAGTNDIIRIANVSSPTSGQWFDLTNGTLLTGNGANNTATIQDVGNGWYRCTRYFDSVATGSSDEIFVANSNADGDTNAISGSTVYLYGFQIENNATSSSYIPTSGSSVSRAAETFTIPSANLPWPTPQYIGDELVTNGTFDTDSDWTKNTGWSIGSGVASYSGGGGNGILQNIGIVTGSVYEITFDITSISSGGLKILCGFDNSSETFNSTGTHTAILVGGSNGFIYVQSVSSTVASIDSISVREINPLSVSIAMDGRMTYADTGVSLEARPFRWYINSSNNIDVWLRTDGAFDGAIEFKQIDAGVSDFVRADPAYYPDILVPFDIASRHGSTFINGATDGVALTANTTPTALPDLSATDLSFAYDYMGTIGTFRVWDKDLGDDGIVEATNPSLEPSLSLTFEGTGTNSFVVNDWSQ